MVERTPQLLLHLAGTVQAGAVWLRFASGLVLVGVQGALVPKLGWPALRLLRAGIPLAVVAFVVLAAAGQLWSITLAFALLSFGLGLAIPGFTAAPTLVVEAHQQGSVAGLINATIGATFIVGPLVGTALYEAAPVAPILAALGAVAVAFAFVWLSPAVRRTGTPPETTAETESVAG